MSLFSPAAPRLSPERMAQAARELDPVFADSPQISVETLSHALGCELTLKIETRNPVGCFKGRGADGFVAARARRGETDPLICASAGNFGQALAYACRKHAIPVTVFVGAGANSRKVSRIRELGAEVSVAGHDFDAAKAAASERAAALGRRFVEDGAEVEISEGAGTIAVEMLASGNVFDEIVVPLGNGALLGGLGCWIKAHAPTTRVVGVCSQGAPIMAECWRNGEASATRRARVDTIADGIAVRVPVRAALDDVRQVMDDVWLVDDTQIVSAMRLLHQHAGIMAEPAAVAGIAAIAANRHHYEARRVATIVTGGNLTDEQIATWFAAAASPRPSERRP